MGLIANVKHSVLVPYQRLRMNRFLFKSLRSISIGFECVHEYHIESEYEIHDL